MNRLKASTVVLAFCCHDNSQNEAPLSSGVSLLHIWGLDKVSYSPRWAHGCSADKCSGTPGTGSVWPCSTGIQTHPHTRRTGPMRSSRPAERCPWSDCHYTWVRCMTPTAAWWKQTSTCPSVSPAPSCLTSLKTSLTCINLLSEEGKKRRYSKITTLNTNRTSKIGSS